MLIQVSVSAMLRSPRSQTNQVRQAHSRGVCADQSAGSMLVTRSCDAVGKAARLATQARGPTVDPPKELCLERFPFARYTDPSQNPSAFLTEDLSHLSMGATPQDKHS